jgi:hypothetical protein
VGEIDDLRAAVAALETRVQLLEDHLAITQLVAQYGPNVDSGSAEATAGLWSGGSWKSTTLKPLGHRGLLVLVDLLEDRGLAGPAIPNCLTACGERDSTGCAAPPAIVNYREFSFVREMHAIR